MPNRVSASNKAGSSPIVAVPLLSGLFYLDASLCFAASPLLRRTGFSRKDCICGETDVAAVSTSSRLQPVLRDIHSAAQNKLTFANPITRSQPGKTMNLIQSINALLPQTQCGKCGHPGCLPYAQGIAQGEAINKCPPGGDETIAGLAHLLDLPVLNLDLERGHAPPQVAFIREAECIGCTKCIQACPVDAIVGAAKFMHTVIVDECTGCDLCVAPCPVDCIDMLPISAGQTSLPSSNVIAITGDLAQTPQERQTRNRKRDHARQRFESRNARLRRADERRQAERLARAQKPSVAPALPQSPSEAGDDTAVKKARIALTMSRAQLNKSLKAFGHPPIAEQAARLVELQSEYEAAEQALAGLLAGTPVEVVAAQAKVVTADVKRAKVQLAMARAALKKAQTLSADPEQIAHLSDQLRCAEQLLESTGQVPAGTAHAETIPSREALGS